LFGRANTSQIYVICRVYISWNKVILYLHTCCPLLRVSLYRLHVRFFFATLVKIVHIYSRSHVINVTE
jgi:hypothetical protein